MQNKAEYNFSLVTDPLPIIGIIDCKILISNKKQKLLYLTRSIKSNFLFAVYLYLYIFTGCK